MHDKDTILSVCQANLHYFVAMFLRIVGAFYSYGIWVFVLLIWRWWKDAWDATGFEFGHPYDAWLKYESGIYPDAWDMMIIPLVDGLPQWRVSYTGGRSKQKWNYK